MNQVPLNELSFDTNPTYLPFWWFIISIKLYCNMTFEMNQFPPSAFFSIQRSHLYLVIQNTIILVSSDTSLREVVLQYLEKVIFINFKLFLSHTNQKVIIKLQHLTCLCLNFPQVQPSLGDPTPLCVVHYSWSSPFSDAYRKVVTHWSTGWQHSIYIPVPKKGDAKEWNITTGPIHVVLYPSLNQSRYLLDSSLLSFTRLLLDVELF